MFLLLESRIKRFPEFDRVRVLAPWPDVLVDQTAIPVGLRRMRSPSAEKRRVDLSPTGRSRLADQTICGRSGKSRVIWERELVLTMKMERRKAVQGGVQWKPNEKEGPELPRMRRGKTVEPSE